MMVTLPTFDRNASKGQVVEAIYQILKAHSFIILECDDQRPWGAFLRVANEQTDDFIETFFDGATLPTRAQHGERSPKILLVAPQARLSWQYHDRRAEVWRVVSGRVGIMTSANDEQPATVRELNVGEVAQIPQGTRHRLVGLDGWGAVAEIWMHTDPNLPSDEDDVHRLEDDYGRSL